MVEARAADALPDPTTDAGAFIRLATVAACATSADEGAALAGWLGGRLLESRVMEFGGGPGRALQRVGLADGSEVTVARLFPGGRPRRITVEYHEAIAGGRTRPLLSVVVGADCRIEEARRLEYDPAGMADRLLSLAPDLNQVAAVEPINPPVPAAAGPTPGVKVAVIDSGLAYTLDVFAGRLARDAQGRALGYDFWDMDERPFDAEIGRSIFFPFRHGTPVASIIVREAPAAFLIPYRYPRPDMRRMADVVARAEAAGATIVLVPMGSDEPKDWAEFEKAVKARPQMLFVVSAGNDGRDIDRAPVYPAALALPNFLVVTSADAFGRLAEGSNWGPNGVDLMVPGEHVPVIDHRGAAGKASGSSFAAPRVAALAARLLARHPEWRAPELKRAILARVRPPRAAAAGLVRYGWIPDPADDF